MPLRFYNYTPNCLNKFNHVPRKKNSLTSVSSFSNNVGVALRACTTVKNVQSLVKILSAF